jgi:hypothetical protein
LRTLNGNATLAAAWRFARVTSTDYVGALLDHGRKRAEAEGFSIAFQEAVTRPINFDRSIAESLSAMMRVWQFRQSDQDTVTVAMTLATVGRFP